MKHRIRKEMRRILAAIPPREAARKSFAASEALMATAEFGRARTVMAYLSFTHELDMDAVLQAALTDSKRIIVPRVQWEPRGLLPLELQSLTAGLEVSEYGIREPQVGTPWPLEDIDLVVVPGLAFDRRGNRLGRGGGFYDIFLSQPQLRAIRCGIAYGEQLIDELPVEDNDLPVDMLVTDTEVLHFGRPRRD